MQNYEYKLLASCAKETRFSPKYYKIFFYLTLLTVNSLTFLHKKHAACELLSKSSLF